MKVNNKQAPIVHRAIDEWQRESLLDEETAAKLHQSVKTYDDDYKSLSFYAFIAAISCAVLAFGALVLNEKWIERFRRFFDFSEVLIGIVFMGVTLALTYVAKRRRQKYPDAVLANESFTLLIALSAGVGMVYIGRSFDFAFNYYGGVLFAASVLCGVIGYYLRSKLLWVCMLVLLVSAFATQTFAWSGDAEKSYFLGMNYPLRMTVLGGLMIAASQLLTRDSQFMGFFKLTYYGSWVFFLLSALFLSVSGNHSYDVWAAIKQGRMWPWMLGYTLLLIALIVYVMQKRDETLRDIAIAFFLLNIYTRYFEFFWDITNKGLFFAILAFSFWLAGRKLEQMRKKLV
ncbi:MAG: DUF2157 domain-containing protein [Niabella sp.]